MDKASLDISMFGQEHLYGNNSKYLLWLYFAVELYMLLNIPWHLLLLMVKGNMILTC